MKQVIKYKGKEYELETTRDGNNIVVEYEGARYTVEPVHSTGGALPSAIASQASPPPPAPSSTQSSPAPSAAPRTSESAGGAGDITAPMNGVIKQIHVAESQRVASEELVISMEAMKMEVEIKSPRAGTVTAIAVSAGDTVEQGDRIASIE